MMYFPCYFVHFLPFSALMLVVGRQEGHPACKKIERLGAGLVVCLERGADLHTAQLMPLHPKTPSSLASFKSRLVLPFWFSLTWVVLKKSNNWHSAGSLGWPFPVLKYKYIFQIKYTEAILLNSTRKLFWFEITEIPVAFKKINLLCHLL